MKNLSPQNRAERRHGADARIGEQFFRVSDHHVLKEHTHNEVALQQVSERTNKLWIEGSQMKLKESLIFTQLYT
jgi:hypothetical protein